jgi:hypothetical protein
MTTEATAPDLNRRQIAILCACIAMLGFLGWLDYSTGYELGFFVFYSVPIGLAAWWVGRWPAIGVALAATLTWYLADSWAGEKYSSRFFLYWNNAVHFVAFVINAVTIAKIKSDIDQRHQLRLDLACARNALRTVAPLLPLCPGCGRRHDRGEPVFSAAVLTAGQQHPELGEALCHKCLPVDTKQGEVIPSQCAS